MGEGGQCHAPTASPPGKDPLPTVKEAGWGPGLVRMGVENLAPPPPTRIPSLGQCFSNFFQVGTTFISQNVLRATLLVPFKSKLFEILNYSVWYAIHVNFIFSVFFGLMFNLRGPQGQNPRTTVWETLPLVIQPVASHYTATGWMVQGSNLGGDTSKN
jgi:hypothetical protein